MPTEVKPADPEIVPVKGSDAVAMPHPNLPLGPLPPPFVPVPEPFPAGAPGARVINLGEMLDRVFSLGARLDKLGGDRVKFFADCRQRLDREIEALKKSVRGEIGGIREGADLAAKEIGGKIEERYAEHFRTVKMLDENAAEALFLINTQFKDSGDAVKTANAASGKALHFAGKLDILLADFAKLKAAVGTQVATVKGELAGRCEEAKAAADLAAKTADSVAKDVPKLNARVAALEEFRNRQIQGRPRR
jgi:hypothetical protein